MKSDYSEIIRLFEQSRDNANELVNLFKRLQEEEKEVKNESLIRWRPYPKEKPSKSGYYTIAVNTKGMTSYIDMAFYNNNLMCWTVNSDPASELYEKVYDFAPMAWTKIELPDYLRG